VRLPYTDAEGSALGYPYAAASHKIGCRSFATDFWMRCELSLPYRFIGKSKQAKITFLMTLAQDAGRLKKHGVTMSSPVPSDDTDSYEPWDPFEFSSQQNTQASKLELCQYANWSPKKTYDEDPLSYIHYSIEWKITVNNRAIMPKDTEQDLVLEPAAY
jgi:hypothetical protein